MSWSKHILVHLNCGFVQTVLNIQGEILKANSNLNWSLLALATDPNLLFSPSSTQLSNFEIPHP